MKKILLIIIATSILIAPLNAMAAVKAGDSCKKVGSTATSGGKKYTCIKNGKKLVWNKGVNVAASKPSPVATPTPTSTPTSSPTPTPSASPTPTVSKFVPPYIPKTFEELEGNISGVIYGAWFNTVEQMKSGKSQLGNVQIFSAPGTEEGGATLMIKEGALDNPKVDAVFGLHIESQIPVGVISYKSGAFMASSDWFTIKVKGKGSHGSQPWGGVDPIAASAQIIEGLQHIVSRQMDLTVAPVVITVGTMKGGVRSNIIPETAELSGTIRTLDSKMQEDVHERIRTTVKNIAASSGATADVNIETKTLVTYNDPTLVTKTLPSLIKAAGADKVEAINWATGAEDFSYYGKKAPSFFFYLGGLPKGTQAKDAGPHHTSDFYLDESGFIVGVKAFTQLVFDYVKVK